MTSDMNKYPTAYIMLLYQDKNSNSKMKNIENLIQKFETKHRTT